MLNRMMPTRAEAQESVKIISDFDALLHEKVGFKFQNKTHILEPVNVENFMRLTLAYENLRIMIEKRSRESLADEEVYQRYFDFISPIVPTVTYAEIRGMTLVLLNNLVNLVFRQLAGDPALYENKAEKKNPQIR